MRSLPVLLSIAALIVACTKSESSEPKPTGSTTDVPPMASSAPVASASASAAATTSATATGTTTNATDSGATAATPGGTDGGGATADAGKAASANMSGAGECGTKPLPDCPLQAWMKSNMNPPVMTADTAKLADALEKAAGYAPPGYTNWTSIAKDGAKAAKGGDLAAAKASCRSCHDQYKNKYKTELRTRKI